MPPSVSWLTPILGHELGAHRRERQGAMKNTKPRLPRSTCLSYAMRVRRALLHYDGRAALGERQRDSAHSGPPASRRRVGFATHAGLSTTTALLVSSKACAN